MASEKTAMAILEKEQPGNGSKKTNQYLAAFIATIGGFIAGTALGWLSPAAPMILVEAEYIGWIGSCMPLGAMIGCPFTAYLVDKLGRKKMMLIMSIPAFIGWAMILWAKPGSGYLWWLYTGRLLTGYVGGAFSVIVPLYTSEIAEKEIRGTLGTYFQLQVTAGILFTYIVGPLVNSFFNLTVSCAIIPIIYFVLVVFIPESPTFHLMKGNVEEARLSLRYFRGPLGNIDQELTDLQDSLAKTERERVPMIEAFQTTPAKRGLLISLGVMLFQQFSGCNAVIFFATNIFKSAGSDIDPSLSSIIVGLMSVVATYISTLIVDKLGRKILLLSSIIVMGICTFSIGLYFYLAQSGIDVSSIGFIPLVSLCIFIVMFSIGFGPIPWMLIGEILPAQIKGTACSIACMANWLFAFFVTKFFLTLKMSIGDGETFWVFTMFCLLGMFFVISIVLTVHPQTQRTIHEMSNVTNYDFSIIIYIY